MRNGIALPPDAAPWPTASATAGYATGYIGKWHLARPRARCRPSERGGYEYWLASNVLEFTSDAYDTRHVSTATAQPVKLPGYRVDALTDAAIRYIDAHQADPFFLFISYIEPHFQNHIDDYPPPDGYRERYTGRWMPPDLAALGGSAHQHLGGYYGMVKRLDEALGRLLDALQEPGPAGRHDRALHLRPRQPLQDAQRRVQALLPRELHPRAHGHLRARLRRRRAAQQLVSLVDLPPTLLDAGGLPVPAAMQGRSILPLLRGQAVDWPEEVFIQISESQVGRAVRTRRWKYGVDAPDKNGGATPPTAMWRNTSTTCTPTRTS